MKSATFTLCLFLLLNFHANAQLKGLWIAPQGSFGSGLLKNFKVNGADPEFSLNFNFGADAYYMFNNNIGAGAGLALGGYGTEWKTTYDNQNVNFIIGHRNLDVPVFFRYTTGVKNAFFVQTGLITSFLLSAVQEVVTEDNQEELLKVDGDQAKDNFAKVSLYPYIYLGADITCGQRVRLSVGPYFQYQLNNDFSDSTPLKGNFMILGGKIAVGMHVLRK